MVFLLALERDSLSNLATYTIVLASTSKGLKGTFCWTWFQNQGPAQVDRAREDFDAYRI